MPRIPTDQVTVLTAVVGRLIDQVSEFNPANCFLSLETEPDFRLSHPLCCLVSPMGGQFEHDVFVGGGMDAVIEDSGVIVSVWSNLKRDQRGHAGRVLADQSRGLLILKGRILAALAGHDLADGDGNQLLVNLMAPRQSQHPQTGVQVDQLTGFSLMFATDFEWDLTAAAAVPTTTTTTEEPTTTTTPEP